MDGIIHDSRPGFSILPTRSDVPSCCWSMAHGLASCLPHWSVVRFRGMARFGTLSNQWSQWAVEIEASWMTSTSAPEAPARCSGHRMLDPKTAFVSATRLFVTNLNQQFPIQFNEWDISNRTTIFSGA